MSFFPPSFFRLNKWSLPLQVTHLCNSSLSILEHDQTFVWCWGKSPLISVGQLKMKLYIIYVDPKAHCLFQSMSVLEAILQNVSSSSKALLQHISSAQLISAINSFCPSMCYTFLILQETSYMHSPRLLQYSIQVFAGSIDPGWRESQN